MATVEYCHFATATGLAREVYDDIVRTYGIREPHGIYQLMGHTPRFLAASWQRSRYLYGSLAHDTNVSLSRLTLAEKHYVTLAISATNNCQYCVLLHGARLKQLGMTEQRLLELLMVVDVVNGEDKFAEGVRLGDPQPVVPPASGTDAADIDAFRACIPGYDAASGQRRARCFVDEGSLGLRTKHMVALGIAATNGNDYFIDHYLRRLRELGAADADLVELMLVIDLACGYNRYVQGLQVAPGERAFVPSGERGPVPAHS